MSINQLEAYRDPELSKKLVARIHQTSRKKIRLMEVCGTHTVSIFRSGIRSLLPPTISLISGPGCPVCVTDQTDIDAFMALAHMDRVIVATFGDLMRVPGTQGSLQQARAGGRSIRVVYSPLDAVEIARENPDHKVVFLGVGFETTAPTIAASLSMARKEGIKNFLVYSAHKLVPPALNAIMGLPDVRIDGFILPGHVSVIIGAKAYEPFVDEFKIPSVIAGFEPVDLLKAIWMLAAQIEKGDTRLENAYPRAVCESGNQVARDLLERTFEITDAPWRGIGTIPQSGLVLRQAYRNMDARHVLPLIVPKAEPPKGCRCGAVLTGRLSPPDCPLYKTVCTPMHPVGPCMVSSEGTCAAFYAFAGK